MAGVTLPTRVGGIALMARRALAACATGPDDYAKVYDRVLGRVAEPVVIHRLGEMFEPTVPLSRHIFRAPTWFYKTGVTFLACLIRLADAAGVLGDPDMAAVRACTVFTARGVDA